MMPPVRVKLSSNGQISLPAEIRRRWAATEFLIVDAGDYVIVGPVNPEVDVLDELRGWLKAYPGQSGEEYRRETRELEAELEERRYGHLPGHPRDDS